MFYCSCKCKSVKGKSKRYWGSLQTYIYVIYNSVIDIISKVITYNNQYNISTCTLYIVLTFATHR